MESGKPPDRAKVAAILRHWRKDADLAAIRDADALATLPEAERRDWLALWDEVDALIRKAIEPTAAVTAEDPRLAGRRELEARLFDHALVLVVRSLSRQGLPGG